MFAIEGTARAAAAWQDDGVLGDLRGALRVHMCGRCAVILTLAIIADKYFITYPPA